MEQMRKTKGVWTEIYRVGIMVIMMLMMLSIPTPVQAATSAHKEACRAEVKEMLYSVDTTTHNIYQYRLTPLDFEEVLDDMKTGEERLIWASYYSNMKISYTTKYFWVNEITIENADANVLKRYARLTENVNRIMAGVDASMTDLDKILYLHDALVETCRYGYLGYQSYGTCGALGENRAVCAGYAKAYQMLLDMVGIENNYMQGDGIDHGWVSLKLDGEWYHVDPTWDDTRSGVTDQTGHYFLLRTDDEFKAGGYNSHVGWKVFNGENVTCDSTRFCDWFVHGIKGKMLYDQGDWYYVDPQTGYIMKGNLSTGPIATVRTQTAGKTTWLQSLEGSVLTYTVDGQIMTTDVNEEETVIEVPEGSTEEIPEELPEGSTEETPENNPGQVTEETQNPVEEENNTEQPGSTEKSLEEVNLSDFANWRSGLYHWSTGKYLTYPSRICLNDYVLCNAGTEYHVSLSDPNYQVLVRELDANKNFLASYDLKDQDAFVTTENTVYMAISLYCPSNSKLVMADYQQLFANGFTIQIQSEEKEEEVIVDDTSVENCDFSDFANWRSGQYSFMTGAYEKYKQRICLTEYKTFSNEKYQVVINNPEFHILIREMDGEGNYIRSNNLADGEIYVPGSDAVYLGIGVYCYSGENEMNYSVYESLFQQGFYAGLSVVE